MYRSRATHIPAWEKGYNRNKMGTIWAAFSLLQALCLGVAHCSLPSIRGLNPSLAEQYRPQGDKFNCLDGEKIIMYSFINDDFCDCFDGSDEPGECGYFVAVFSALHGARTPAQAVSLCILANRNHQMYSSTLHDEERLKGACQ